MPVSRPRGLAAEAFDRRARILVAVVCSGIFFDALDLSITQIALPSIQASLDVAVSALPWVAAAYVVTYGGFLLLGGRASDLVGSRPVLLGGLAVFGAASLACGLAGSVGVLVAARAVQGVGAAFTVPAAISILATAFPDGRPRARAFGVYAAAAASGFTAGLVIGGLITDGLSWRWIFLVKVPAVAVTLLAGAWAVPRARSAGSRRGYDVAGAVLLTAGAVLLMLGITWVGAPGASSAVAGVLVLAGAVLLAAFLAVERAVRTPLLPLRLLRLRTQAAANGAALTVLAAPFGVSFVVTVYLQDVLHRSPWETALTLVPGAVLSALVARFVAPVLLGRVGLRAVYAGGLLVVAAGDALLLVLTPDAATWLVIAATVVSFGPGMGLAYPAANIGGVHAVEPADQGAAAGLNNAALQIGGGLGLAIVSTAVAAGLHGAPMGSAGTHAVEAARLGALAATLLPLAGALIALVGLPRRSAET